MYACITRNLGEVTFLVQAGADRSIKDSGGRTVYDYANDYGVSDALKTILSAPSGGVG